MNPTTRKLHALGQSLWIDNITRTMVADGTLSLYIDELSITGLTSNPTIFEHAIGKGDAYDRQIAELAKAGHSGEDLFFALAQTDLRAAADLFAPIHEKTNGVDGWVSLEVSPLIADDAARTIEAAQRLHDSTDRPNVFIKIPGTRAGTEAIEASIFAGVPVNVTLLFSCEQYLAAAEAYLRGIERRIEAGLDPVVESVASIFVSRWDVAVHDSAPPALRNQLGIAISKRIYAAYRELFASDRWKQLAKKGAHPQRLLWASTGVKDPSAPPTLYVEALAAPDTVNTLPDKTLEAIAAFPKDFTPMGEDASDGEAVIAAYRKVGIDDGALAARLQREGAESFAKSWRSLIAGIGEKVAALSSAEATGPGQ